MPSSMISPSKSYEKERRPAFIFKASLDKWSAIILCSLQTCLKSYNPWIEAIGRIAYMSDLMDIQWQFLLHRYWKSNEVSFRVVEISNMEHGLASSHNSLFMSSVKLNLNWWNDMPPSSLLNHGPIDEFSIFKLLNKMGH